MLFTNLVAPSAKYWGKTTSAFLSTKEWKFVDVCFPALYFDYIHLIRIVNGLFICLCLLWLSELLVLQSTGDNKWKTTFTWSTTTNKKKNIPRISLPLPANQIWRTGTSQRRTTCLVRPHLQHNNVNFKKSCIRWCQIIRRLMTFLHLQRSYETSSGINCSRFSPVKISRPGVLTCTIYTNHPGGNFVHKHKRNGTKHLIFHVNDKYPWSSLRMLWSQLASTWSVLLSKSDEISSKALISMQSANASKKSLTSA